MTHIDTQVQLDPVAISKLTVLRAMQQCHIEPRVALKAATVTILRKRTRLEVLRHPVTATKEGYQEYELADPGATVLYRVLSERGTGRMYLLNDKGQPDTYAWDAETYANKAGKMVPIGVNSDEGRANLDIVAGMLSDYEAELLREDIGQYRKDAELLLTKPENRIVVEVSPELYAAGVTSCVNDWETAKSGFRVTTLEVGDFLVITDRGVYCVRRAEFLDTHPTFIPELDI